MYMESDVFAKYAKAEKELCEIIDSTLCDAIQQVERRHGVVIAEFRVTMGNANSGGWPRANCVLVSAVAGVRFPRTLAARVDPLPVKNPRTVDDTFSATMSDGRE